jgi:hypothetical protein
MDALKISIIHSRLHMSRVQACVAAKHAIHDCARVLRVRMLGDKYICDHGFHSTCCTCTELLGSNAPRLNEHNMCIHTSSTVCVCVCVEVSTCL